MGEQVAARLIWGCSSVGRAPALQAGGQGFESLHLHCESIDSRLYLENRISNQYLNLMKIRDKTSEADLMEVRSETSKQNRPSVSR